MLFTRLILMVGMEKAHTYYYEEKPAFYHNYAGLLLYRYIDYWMNFFVDCLELQLKQMEIHLSRLAVLLQHLQQKKQ